MRSGTVLELRKWNVRRGNEVSVGPLDLDFSSGSVTTLIGPSGVGKTTLLTTLLGYEDSGLTINGERRQDGTPLAPGATPKRALYIPQHLPFNPNWEVQGFLARLPWGAPSLLDLILPFKAERLKRVHEVLEQLGIAHRARATIAELSGGEAQRAALAQMLLLKPKVFVGDEFVSALDPGMSTWILEQCRQEVAHSGGAAILALHDVQAAMHVSDRILLLWPATVSSQPWQIDRGTSGWHGSALYSLSCLARWVKDFQSNDSVRHLVNQLNIWFSDERALRTFLHEFEWASTLVIDGAGNHKSVSDQTDSPPCMNGSSGDWTNMTPVRMSIAGEPQIGISIPRGNKPSLTILAGGRKL